MQQNASNSSAVLPEEDEFWKHVPNSDLLHILTNTTWQSFIRSHQRVLLTVYSKDCPNCKDVRKHLAKCARSVKEENVGVDLAVIDSDKYSEYIYQFWVTEMGVPTLLWFENGRKQFEYEQSRTSQDLLQFVKNPVKPEVKKSYPNWSMDEAAEDIYHLQDEGFEQFANEQNGMMVFFYSPTCSTCYKLRKVYEQTALQLDIEKPDVTLAAVNIVKALRLKAKYSISSYPYFAYFYDGKFKYQYHGKFDIDSIIAFMKKPAFIEKKKADKDWSLAKTNVTILQRTSFYKSVKASKHTLVMFYAKWCSHCLRFKPQFVEAADSLKSKTSDAHLAAFDGEESKKILERYNVTGFPTLIYFRNGKYIERYRGPRTAVSVVKFMTGLSGKSRTESPTQDKDEILSSKPPEVEWVTPSNLTTFLEENDESVVMFYAPWCGACKNAKGPFFQASVEASEDLPDVGFGIFNAEKYASFLKDFDIKGYPTFWYFEAADRKFKYHGDITKRGFLNFLSEPQEQKPLKPIESATHWINEISRVNHLHKDNFEDFIKKYNHVMLFFYVDVCTVCLTHVKPEYVKAAEELGRILTTSVGMAAVNAGPERSISTKYEINSFPSFLYFHKGKARYRYYGSWKSEDVIKFMRNPSENLAKKVKPTSWQDMDQAEYGHVIHLGNETYEDFIKKHQQSVVLFHSLYYQSCDPARRHFRIAADEFHEVSDVGFGAVDCHRQPQQGLVCYHLTVRKFPSLKYYEKGEFFADLQIGNFDQLVKYLKERSLLTRTDETSEKDEL
ncbi:unnamed protein product [Clavelina lepadiformis]|uniref:Thioredoxin domain-containing protein n=1 Tax=Clavelina lepadiformis TaxID=159417 RepID=A0ABP0F1K3_CLALP